MHPEPNVLAGRDPVVWQLTAYRPLLGAAEVPLVELRELVASLGCKILYFSDEVSNSFDDWDFHLEWRVRVPRAEHERRGPDGHPLVIEKITRCLRGEVPLDQRRGGRWRIAPHEDDTLRFAAGQTLRAAYADLLDPLENALAPLRRDGAENYEPHVTCWGNEEGLQVGAWNLRLCPNYEHFLEWVVISAGVAVDERVQSSFDAHFGYPDSFDPELTTWADNLEWDRPPLRERASPGLDPRHPILLLPRSDQPIWSVTLARPSFSRRAELSHRAPDPLLSRSVDSCHQWTAVDPQCLVDQVTQHVCALLPHL
ncbi:MAG: hypothetical protein ACRDTE_28730 [Pseudonocardiaceae bacterium]